MGNGNAERECGTSDVRPGRGPGRTSFRRLSGRTGRGPPPTVNSPRAGSVFSVRFLLLAVLAVPAVPAVLAVGGCSGGPSEAGVAPSLGTGGPDAILLRVPRDGGRARAYRWGRGSARAGE